MFFISGKSLTENTYLIGRLFYMFVQGCVNCDRKSISKRCKKDANGHTKRKQCFVVIIA
jgi:hypothetical protein